MVYASVASSEGISFSKPIMATFKRSRYSSRVILTSLRMSGRL